MEEGSLLPCPEVPCRHSPRGRKPPHSLGPVRAGMGAETHLLFSTNPTPGRSMSICLLLLPRHTHTDTDTHGQTETDTQTQTHTHRDTHKMTHTQTWT